MKRCPECRRDYYDETLLYCLDDGTALLEGPSSGGDRKTEIIESPDSQRTGILTEGETKILPASSSKNKFTTPVFVLVGVLLLAGIGYGIYYARQMNGAPTTARGSTEIQTQRLSGDGRTVQPKISPDGKFLAFVKLEEGNLSLWVKQIATGSNVNVVKPGEVSRFDGLTFSPDGSFIYFNTRMKSDQRPTVYRAPSFGGTPPVKFISDASNLQFSPDGRSISFRRSGPQELHRGILIANADGTNERVLLDRSGKQFFTTGAAWSPDGKYLAVGIGDDALGSTNSVSIGLVSVEDGSLREIGSRRWDDLTDVVWHPSGDSLIVVASETSFRPGQVWELSYPSGEYRRLTNDLNGHAAISLTSDGRSIVTGEGYNRSAVWVSSDLKAENAKQVMPSTGDTWGLSWTPDGRIVYVSDQTGDSEVWIMNADGSEGRPLTNDRIFKLCPYVSPDGNYVVYTSSQNGGQIVRIDIGGGNSRVLTKAIGADNAHISPDGKWVIYSAFVEGYPTVLRVPIDGGEEQVLTARRASEPRYSNDGTRFACFMFNEDTLQSNNIAVFPAEGGSPIANFEVPRETDRGRGPVWTPDDKGIVLIVARGERQNLWLQPVDGGPGKQMTDMPLPSIARRDYSRDGKRIAIVRAESIGNAIMITNFR